MKVRLEYTLTGSIDVEIDSVSPEEFDALDFPLDENEVEALIGKPIDPFVLSMGVCECEFTDGQIVK